MRKIRQSHMAAEVEIDLAPMIDCIFILLIFFIVTSVFVEDPGITVEKPDVSNAEQAVQDALLIAIDSHDDVYFDGQRVDLGQVSSELRRAAFAQDTPVIIQADRAASHGMFAAVYAEAKRAGLGRVQFATAARSVE